MNALLKFAAYLDDDIAAYTESSANAYRNRLGLMRETSEKNTGKAVLDAGAGIAGMYLGAKALERGLKKVDSANPLLIGAGMYGVYKGGNKLYKGVDKAFNKSNSVIKGIKSQIDYRGKLNEVNSDISAQRNALKGQIMANPDAMDALAAEYGRNKTFVGRLGNMFTSHDKRVSNILKQHNYSPNIVRNVDFNN